jgi:hypothetical protein
LYTLILAFMSWKYVEEPFRNRKKFDRKSIFLLSAMAILASLSVGIVTQFKGGFSDVRSDDKFKLIVGFMVRSPERESCHSGLRFRSINPEDACEYFSVTSNMAVIGDSHAVELAYEHAILGRESRVGVKHLSASGCSPILKAKTSVRGNYCQFWFSDILTSVKEREEIQHVVLAFSYSIYFSAELGAVESAGNKIERLLALRRSLKQSGKNVILVAQVSELLDHKENLAFSGEWVERGIRSMS